MPLTGRRRSVEASRFSMVPRADVPRSAFDVMHTHKTTFQARYLIPVYVDEVLPGDSHRLRMTALARLATPLAPIMDNIVLESHFFFVPCRLVWEHWERFMGERDSPSDTTVFLIPQLPLVTADLVPGTVADYFGITVNGIADRTINVNALPFRCYQLIYDDWFRDTDIQGKQDPPVDDGPDSPATMNVLLGRNKQRDYFTSARPFPQGTLNIEDSGVANGPLQPGGRMLLGLSAYGAGAPVTGLGVATNATTSPGPTSTKNTGGRTVDYAPLYSSNLFPFHMEAHDTDGFPDVRVLVNDMRMATMVQAFLEKLSRGGSRYAEMVEAIYGVRSPDARLQRPEYLGGGRSFVNISPIAQTSASGATGTTTVLGEQAATGHAVLANHGFSQSFTEHGYIIGLVSVRPDITYQNGTHRMWWRRTQFDFYSPPFAHLGEQAVMQGEIFSAGVAADKSTVFGYQERWSEYKYAPSRTSGYMRSVVSTPLDFWHVAENFSAAPTLNSNFILVDQGGINRALQTETLEDQQFIMDALFEVRKVRAMPMFSIPGVSARM